jgi:hypothetical protein
VSYYVSTLVVSVINGRVFIVVVGECIVVLLATLRAADWPKHAEVSK